MKYSLLPSLCVSAALALVAVSCKKETQADATQPLQQSFETAEPAKKPQYMPTAMSSTAMLVSQLVLNKGMSKMRNPARTFFTQENWCLMNAFWYEPEGSGDQYTQWHTWTASNSSEWSGTPREHYNNLHEQGGNLTACDGHAEYRKNRQTSSLDFGLVDAAQRRDSPYQPTEAHSRAPYVYQ